jgi:hypothetical protein
VGGQRLGGLGRVVVFWLLEDLGGLRGLVRFGSRRSLGRRGLEDQRGLRRLGSLGRLQGFGGIGGVGGLGSLGSLERPGGLQGFERLGRL